MTLSFKASKPFTLGLELEIQIIKRKRRSNYILTSITEMPNTTREHLNDDHMVYVFITDNQTAGKSAAPFLKLRNPKLPTPYLMRDALTANIPENISSDLYLLHPLKISTAN